MAIFVGMKAYFLFGLRFAKNEQLKTDLLNHYTDWKKDKLEAYQRENRDHIVNTGVALGFSREVMESEFDRIDPFRDQSMDFSEVEGLVREHGCKHYYITKSVIRICKRLRVKEPFDLNWLAPIEDGKRQLNFQDGFIRFDKKGSRIVVLAAAQTSKKSDAYFQYTFFNLNIDKNTVAQHDSREEDEDLTELSARDFDEESRRLFFQLITFMELAPIEVIELPAGQKHGHKKSEDSLFNETDFPIIIVNTNWNRIIHVGPIDVNGHFRLQPWGPARCYRRLIYISEYSKTGYNVKAGKQKEN